MVDATWVVTFFLTYKACKKYGVDGIDRPSSNNTWSHFQVAIVVGHALFILGQYFLLSAGANLVLETSSVLILVLLAILISDVQDIVYRKRPIWLYGCVLLEYILWSSLALVAFLSGRFGEGALLFVASLSRIADLFHLYNETIALKEV